MDKEPVKTLFTIDVGNLSEKEASKYIENLMKKFKNKDEGK